jgi:hypothetical protein
MRALSAALIALFVSTLSASAATDDELKKMLIGKWSPAADCSGVALIFSDDGTFVSDNLDGNADNDMKGTFTIKDGKLNGAAGDRAMPEVSLRFEGNDKVFFDAEGMPQEPLLRCAA